MWLPSPDAQPDSHVADIALREIGKRMHFSFLRLARAGQLSNLLLDFRRRIAASARQIGIPQPHIPPSLESLRLCPATRWKERHHHALIHALPRRHIRLKLDRAEVRHNPLMLFPADPSLPTDLLHPYLAPLPPLQHIQCT